MAGCHRAAGEGSIKRLQLPVIAALVGKVEGIDIADRRREVGDRPVTVGCVDENSQPRRISLALGVDLGLGRVEHAQLRHARSEACLGVVRLERQHAVEVRRRLGELVLHVQGIRQVEMGLGEIGIEGQRASQIRDRLLGLALLLERQSHVHDHAGAVRGERDRVAPMVERFVDLSLQVKDGSEVRVRSREPRPQCQRPAKMRRRGVEPALIEQQIAQLEMRVGEVGIEANGLMEAGRRLVRPPQGQQHEPAVVVPFRDLAVDRDRARDAIERRVRAPGLVRQDARQIEARRMVRLELEDALVEPCGFGQASGLVLLLGGGEKPLGLGPPSGC
jgi:hypothetical protein